MSVNTDHVILAHGAGGGADETFVTLGLALIVFGTMRALNKQKSLGRRWLGGTLIAAGIFAIASPFLFRFGSNQQAAVRIASGAQIEIVEPEAGAVMTSDSLQVRIRVQGARLVDKTSTNLKPTEGHLHMWLDGREFQRNIRESERLDISDLEPGQHLLAVELAATDHGSFNPPVRALVTFSVRR